MKIQAAVVHEPGGKFFIEEIDLAEPKANEVLIKIVSCGVCHTDAAQRAGHRTPFPAVFGHEGSGIVEKLGPGVTGFAVGDHVALSYPSCLDCPNCNDGKNNYCYRAIELSFMGRMADGSTPISQNGQPLSHFFGQSSFATHVVAHVNNIVKIDEDVDMRLIGPMGCGVQTGAGSVINAFKAKAGDSIVVFGVGSVGLSAIMAAKVVECATIIAVDVFPQRLEMAMDLGATHVINSKETPAVDAEIKAITGGVGVDFALDTTGREDCLKMALMSMHTGGKGGGVAPTGAVSMDSWVKYFAGKSWAYIIQGEAIPQQFIPYLIDLYKQGKFPIDKIISFYDFAQINEAFEANHTGAAIKPVLIMP